MKVDNYIKQIKEFVKDIDEGKLKKAYHFAEKAHEGQLRKSGEPYFIHPVAVSLIVAELHMDLDTIISCLLHDTIEDTEVTYEDIEREFGESVAIIVDGVTKLTKMHYESKEEKQVENLRKMFLAMARDIRVVIVKLVDRLHNMRTLEYQTPVKKVEKSLETLEIYVPIAHRLGIFKIKSELEDIALSYLEPEVYNDIQRQVDLKSKNIKKDIEDVIEKISKELDDAGIKYDIYGRQKNNYSIYRKIKFKNKSFSEIFDIVAVRIIVDSIKDCYSALGVVHTLWKPIPRKIKDYIAIPKPNMYRSIHTTVLGSNGQPFEVQIRTHEMHYVAEYGIAAHFNYKESKSSMDSIDEKLIWIRQLMEWQGDVKNPEEFLDSLKIDFLNHQVYVFTPQSNVIELPIGSTPVDFAYKIHTEVGNKCIGAKVNSRIVPLSYKLNTGEICEILTQKNSPGPSRDWLTFVKTAQAKNKIKHWFKKEKREENIEKGKDILDKEIRKAGYKVSDLLIDTYLDPIMARLSVYSLDDLYAAIGYGGILINQVLPKLKAAYKKDHKTEQEEVIPFEKSDKRSSKSSDGVVKIEGIDDMMTRFAKCCSPVPGDDIIGYITRGRGVTIHRSDCKNFEHTEGMENRFIEVSWSNNKAATFEASVQIVAQDKKGLLTEVTSLMSTIDLLVTGISAKSLKTGVAIVNLTIEVSDNKKIETVIARLKQIEDIIDVKRVTS